MLLKDSPEDEEVGQMLKDAQAQLRKQQGGQAVKRTNHNGNDAAPAHSNGIIVVSSNERFRDYVTSPGNNIHQYDSTMNVHFFQLFFYFIVFPKVYDNCYERNGSIHVYLAKIKSHLTLSHVSITNCRLLLLKIFWGEI